MDNNTEDIKTTKNNSKKLASKKLNQSMSFYLVITIVTVFLILIVYKLNGSKNVVTTTGPIQESTIDFNETDIKFGYNYDSNTLCAGLETGEFYICSKNSIKFVNLKGEEVWSELHNLNKPVIKIAGEYLIIYEPKNNYFSVYSTKGSLFGGINLEGGVQYATINKEGSSSVLIKKDDTYLAICYSKTGEEIFKYAHQQENLFPITLELSDDSKILATSLLNIAAIEMETHVLFQTLEEVKPHENQDRTIHLYKKPNQIVGKFIFLGNNIITFSDTEIETLKISKDRKTIESLKMEKIGNNLNYIEKIDDENFVVSFGSKITNKESKEENSLFFYNYNLEEQGSFKVKNKITYLLANKFGVIVGSGRTYSLVDFRGKEFWSYNSLQDLKQMIILNKKDTVLFVSNTTATVMKNKSAGNFLRFKKP